MTVTAMPGFSYQPVGLNPGRGRLGKLCGLGGTFEDTEQPLSSLGDGRSGPSLPACLARNMARRCFTPTGK